MERSLELIGCDRRARNRPFSRGQAHTPVTSGGEIQTLVNKYVAQVATNPSAATATADNLTKIDCAYEEPFLSLLLELNLSIARTGESLEGNLCYWDQSNHPMNTAAT